MEQKYILAKKDNLLIIREVAQTEPGTFTLLFEERLQLSDVEAAVKAGKNELIDLFRSHNLYPPYIFAEKLAKGITSMFGDEPLDSLRIEFNDVDALQKAINEAAVQVEDEKELAEIDKLLDEDDSEPDFEE